MLLSFFVKGSRRPLAGWLQDREESTDRDRGDAPGTGLSLEATTSRTTRRG